MIPLSLALACSLAIPPGAQGFDLLEFAGPTIELGVVEFAAGPARGSARFFLEAAEPRVEIRLRNDTAQPIWWLGAGMGCISSHWIVEPMLPNGAPGPVGWQGISCTMEISESVTEAFLHHCAIPPGSEEVWRARPFADIDLEQEEKADPIPPLEWWAWCHEFTLPRATPPRKTMDFEEHGLMLAWSASSGPRAFLGHPDRIHGGAFDPFGPMPTTPSAVPIRIGPLVGEAWLSGEGRSRRVEWILRNPTRREVRWTPRLDPTVAHDGFLFRKDCGCTVARRPLPDSALVQESVLPPGGSAHGSLAPFLDLAEEGPRCEERGHGPERKRWDFVQECSWPAATEEQPAAGPAAWLHVAWREEGGLSLWLALSRDGSDPFEGEASMAASAARRLGAGQVVARATGGDPSTLTIFVAPIGEDVYWQDRDTASSGDFRWTMVDRREFDPWLPPAEAEAGALGPDDLRWWTITQPTELEGPAFGSQLKLAWPGAEPDSRFVPRQPWACQRWVMVPQVDRPEHDRDFELARLQITWDPLAGLDLEVLERRRR